MALKDLVTLSLPVGGAATRGTLALGEPVAPDDPVRRVGGSAELAGRFPRARRRVTTEARRR